jgi:exosortase A
MILTQTRLDASTMLKAAAFAAAILAPFVLYFDTVRSFVAIWNSSETFAHGYVILPISLWLIWQKRAALAQAEYRAWWPGLLLLAMCGIAWLLGQLGDVQVVRQYAFVAMLPATVLTVLGWQAARTIAFPLLFLFFAVPVGEIFIAPLIEFTASFAVAALQLTGIPVLREGPNFTLPTGNWSVVEACSGIRYLISSVTLGCLYSYLTYRSWRRRAMFMAVSVVVPIIANGLRAYMIVMMGHLSGMELAVGADHLIYGWIFFGIVTFIMFWIGSFWREDQDKLAADNAADTASASPIEREAQDKTLVPACIAAILCMSAWPAFAHFGESVSVDAAKPDLSAFAPAWKDAAPFSDWHPHYSPPRAELRRTLQSGGKTVGLYAFYYRNQDAASKQISSTNTMIGELDEQFKKLDESKRSETIQGEPLALRETVIRDATTSFVVWRWYWIGGRFVGNDYLGKLLQAKDRLLMRGDDGATLMVFAPYGEQPEEARTALRAFLNDNLAPIQKTLNANRLDQGKGS